MCVGHSVMSNFLQPYGLLPARILLPSNSPGKNTRVGSHPLRKYLKILHRFYPKNSYLLKRQRKYDYVYTCDVLPVMEMHTIL